MPRQPRYDLPGIAQHLVQRGNNRQPVFFAPDDYQRYRDDLAWSAKRNGCEIHAYVLMTNHVHLLATPLRSAALPKMMQSLGRRFVAYINDTYRRSGTLWEGRYKACLVQHERYLIACHRYIEDNPVRAGMVSHPAEYPFSSYRANAEGKIDPLLTPHPIYLALGSSQAARVAAYRALFESEAPGATVDAIRQTTGQCLVLGTERFKDEIEAQLRRRVRPGKSGRPRKRPPDPGQLEIAV